MILRDYCIWNLINVLMGGRPRYFRGPGIRSARVVPSFPPQHPALIHSAGSAWKLGIYVTAMQSIMQLFEL
jgi:hypothetical protein